MYCRKCGTYMEDDSLFCTSCGTKISQAVNTNENSGVISNEVGFGYGRAGHARTNTLAEIV